MDTARLREWFVAHQRDLPWRDPRTTPWQVLVSEFMLQQTPVARVIPVWETWCERWPTPADLSRASLGDVLAQWGKLGFPRRARNLHRTAQAIVDRHGGIVPSDVETLETLPGIGTYTARAIACFAFGVAVPVVDTNVKRVVARVAGGDADGGHWSTREGLERVDTVSATESKQDYCTTQQALMELGAVVCTSRSPDCNECPLVSECVWRARGYPVSQAVLPRKQARYEGSDRQARGVLLGFLRDHPEPVGAEELLALWSPRAQAERALDSLVADGLAEQLGSDESRQVSLAWQPAPDRGE